MGNILNIFQPSMGKDEADAVRGVMESNWVGRGKLCLDFERKFADHLGVGAEHMLSITSCTDGLFLSMDLLGIREGDFVIVPAISFVGAANAVVAQGGRPLFCDVDKRTLNVTVDNIIDCVTSFPYVRRTRFKAIILMHYGGYPCDMDDISEYCSNKGIAVVEDSACSVASKVDGVACGTIGEIGMWSFDAMKILSTGDGGMVYLKNPSERYRAEKRGYLGLTKDSGLSSDVNSQWWNVDIDLPGRRFLMNDLTAGIGLVQLGKLPDFIARRQAIHNAYMERLADIEQIVLPPPLPSSKQTSYYLFWVQNETGEQRDGLARLLRQRDIYTTFRYYPVHMVRYYATKYAPPSLPNAEKAASTTLCIPIHQSMSDDDVDRVCDGIHDFFSGETK